MSSKNTQYKKIYTVAPEHTAGTKTDNDKLVVDKFIVGDKKKDNYDGQFKMYVYHSDALIRRQFSRGFLFDKLVTVTLWNVTEQNDNSVFLDIGSNVGPIIVPMAKRIKTCYAFEPQKLIRKLLRKNIKKNGVKNNVTVIKKAVGHYNGIAHLDSRIVDHVGNVQELEYTGSTKINYGGVRVGIGGPKTKMITIDSMNLPNVTSMKVDVEGSEPCVFYGAKNTIKKYKPFIAFEKNYQTIEKDSMDALHLTQEILDFDIVKYAESLGYKCIMEIMLDNFLLCPTDIPKTNDPMFKFYPTKNFINNAFSYTKLKMFKLQKPRW